MSELEIPAGWDEVTPAWMTAALGSSGLEAEVERVELVFRDDGTNRRARFRLAYSRGAGPASVFMKAADPEHAQLNAAMGGVFNEPKLFRSNVDLAIEHPSVYAALIDEPSLNFILVMEDIAVRGGDPRDATRPMTIAQVADGARGLAGLHQEFWGRRLVDCDALAWVEPFVAWKGMRRGIDIGLERTADAVPKAIAAMDGREIEDQWSRYIGTVNDGPATLLHGDAHIGNTYLLGNEHVGFLDWQVLRRGNHMLDVGYFVQGALTVEDRRSSEREIVERYHEALQPLGDERPSLDEMWLRYRASTAHGLALWMATAASDTWQRPEVSATLATRYAFAFDDLHAAAAINALG
jgi:hypothetical protein